MGMDAGKRPRAVVQMLALPSGPVWARSRF